MVLSEWMMEQLRKGNPPTLPNPGNYIVAVWNETPAHPKFFCQWEKQDKETGDWVLCVGHDEREEPIRLIVANNPNERLAWGFVPESLQNVARRQVEQTHPEAALVQRLASLAADGGAKLWLATASGNALFGAGSGVTYGLSVLGGGSVASGGLGMMGGLGTVGLATGALATHTACHVCDKLDTSSQNRKAVRNGGIAGTLTGAAAGGAAVVACAAEGTGGAAVITSGLAYLGGGSIAAGGAGMMGGLAVVAAVPVATVAMASGVAFAVSKHNNEKTNRERYEKLCNAVRQATSTELVLEHVGVSLLYGNVLAGQHFSHSYTTKPITKLSIFAGSIVDGLMVEYGDFTVHKHGVASTTDPNTTTALLFQRSDIWLDVNEFIVKIIVRADRDSVVQSLTFITNNGNAFGSFGGQGRPFIDKKGVEQTITATQDGDVLMGFHGRADSKHIKAIGFHWGRVPS